MCDLMERCWAAELGQLPTSNACRANIVFLPRCPPSYENDHHHSHSAELLENFGDLESWKGNYEEGSKWMEKALRLCEQDRNASPVASVLKQTTAWDRNSDHAKAYDIAPIALSKCRYLDDHLASVDGSFWFESSLTVQDRVEEAMPFLQESVEVFRRHGYDFGIVQCLEWKGTIHRWNHRHEEALATLREAVTIASWSRDRLGEAKSLLILEGSY